MGLKVIPITRKMIIQSVQDSLSSPQTTDPEAVNWYSLCHALYSGWLDNHLNRYVYIENGKFYPESFMTAMHAVDEIPRSIGNINFGSLFYVPPDMILDESDLLFLCEFIISNKWIPTLFISNIPKMIACLLDYIEYGNSLRNPRSGIQIYIPHKLKPVRVQIVDIITQQNEMGNDMNSSLIIQCLQARPNHRHCYPTK